MYEEKKFIRKKISWKSVFLKLLLVILVLFLIWFLVYKHKTNKTTPKNNGNSMSENLKYFKDQSIKYFDESNLPTFINAQRKVTLDDMIKAGASKEIKDKDGNKCSRTSSYAQVTKVSGSSYNLKVYIKCKNEADSILTTINKETFISNTLSTKKVNNKDNNKKTDNQNNQVNKNTNNTNTDTTKTTTDTNKTTVETNKTNTTNNTNNTNRTNTNSSSKKTSTSTSSTKTTTTTTTQTSTTSTTTSSTTNSGTSTTTTTTTTTAFVPTEDKLLYTEYKLIKHGDWQAEKPATGKYNVGKIVYNRYCYFHDYQNCHVLPKVEEYRKDIEYLLMQGYEEIYDHTQVIYQPYEIIWSRSQNVEGYTYTGDHKEIYRMN